MVGKKTSYDDNDDTNFSLLFISDNNKHTIDKKVWISRIRSVRIMKYVQHGYLSFLSYSYMFLLY